MAGKPDYQCADCGCYELKPLSPGKLKCGFCGSESKPGDNTKTVRYFDWTKRPRGAKR